MDLAGYRAAVRTETDNDDDDQYDDTQLDRYLYLSYVRLHRRLSVALPKLFSAVTATLTVAADQLLAKPARFGGLYGPGIERLEVSSWIGVPSAHGFNPELDMYIGYTERPASFYITPANSAPGSYRIHYTQAPHDTTFQPTEIPVGFEDVIVQWGAAKGQVRQSGPGAEHYKLGKDLMEEMVKNFKKARHGAGPRPGFVSGFSHHLPGED